MALEEADLTQIAELVAAKLAESEKKTLQGMNDGLTKRLSAAEKAQKEAWEKALEASKVQTPTGPNADPPNASDLKLKTLEAQVQQAIAKQEEAERRAIAATQKSRNAALRSSTADALMKAGITNPVQNQIAVGYLIDSEKRVGWANEEDENDDRRAFRDDSGQLVEFNTGLNQWLKSEAAKHFLPAKGTHGSGSGQGKNGVSRPPTKEELAFEQLRQGLNKL